MPVDRVLALEHLFDAVVARFALEGTNVPNVFGWREPAKQSPAPRICWVPGDPNGAAGALSAPRNTAARNPRSLATLNEFVTIEIYGQDPTKPEEERAQYRATRLLFDAWLRAVYLAAHGTYRVASTNWVNAKAGRNHGTCLRVVLSLEAVVPDSALEAAPVDVGARIDVQSLDQTEQFSVDAESEEEP